MVVGSVFRCRDSQGLISAFGTQLYGARYRVNSGAANPRPFLPDQMSWLRISNHEVSWFQAGPPGSQQPFGSLAARDWPAPRVGGALGLEARWGLVGHVPPCIIQAS